MRKFFFVLLLFSLFLSACSAKPSWQEEEVQEVSTRLLSDHVKVQWELDGSAAASSNETLIRIKIQKNNGEAIDLFDITHEELLHLIVISRDLSYFNHIHPEYMGDGVYEIANEFPAGGDYRLIADFKPSLGDTMTKMTWMQIGGETVEPAPVIPDKELAQVIDGKLVELMIKDIAPKREVTLQFTIADAESGTPITDLEPYLGAIGHVVILSEDGEKYVHVHAEEGQGPGPVAIFEATFPKSGIYKIWGQFQSDGQVFTAPFVVNVP